MSDSAYQTLPLWPDQPNPDVWVSWTQAVSPHGAVLVLPGGGYGHLAIEHEGYDVVAALNAAGFDAALLRYRLGPHHHHPAMIHDATRGMRLLRKSQKNAGRMRPCAVLGFSAGGHLAATLSVHPDTFPCPNDDLSDTLPARPDAAVLCYPVIDLVGLGAHSGSRRNLLGEEPDEAWVRQLSPQLHVDHGTPPTFLWHTGDDASVAAENSIDYALACRKHGVPCELHVYEHGRHGLGLAPESPDVAGWFDLAIAFLRRHLANELQPTPEKSA